MRRGTTQFEMRYKHYLMSRGQIEGISDIGHFGLREVSRVQLKALLISFGKLQNTDRVFQGRFALHLLLSDKPELISPRMTVRSLRS